MLRAWRVADIRQAEEIRLAEVPEGALMQRAAAGLAAVCARELRGRAGGVSGRRVVLLVGAGNNGGDALYAGQRLARRGARVDAVLLANQGHWLVRETTGLLRRTLSRIDVSSRSLFALIEEGSCFTGTFLELALACDRSYQLALPDDAAKASRKGLNPAAEP